MTMTSRERVLTALQRKEPDHVPYCELGVDRALAQRLMNWGEPKTQAANLEGNAYTVEEAKALAAFLRLDNISYVLRAPVYAHKEAGRDGRLFYGDGMITSEADLPRLELPDPYDDALYAGAEAFLRQKGDYAAWFVTRIGIFPAMLSLGTEAFCLALYDNRPFMDDLISVGVIGFHPNEKGAVDIREMKRTYGNRVCLLGNVDLNLLGMGAPEAVDREVRDLIRDVAPGGGYIVTSGNSLAGYLLPENVVALSRAVQEYGRYPIAL